MVTLLVCMGNDVAGSAEAEKVIYSKVFDRICIISEKSEISIVPRDDMSISVININHFDSMEEIQEKLTKELKLYLGKEKVQDLDFALNISSGTGRVHASLISAVMKLGYGMRFIGIDKDGDVAEL